MPRNSLWALLLIALMLLPSGVSAKQTPTVELTSAFSLLPRTAEMGDGWSKDRDLNPRFDPDVYRSTAGVIYLGPSGSRVVIYSWVNKPTREAIQGAWDEANFVLSGVRELTAPPENSRGLTDFRMPEGCEDAMQMEGLDLIARQPVGVTLCAVGFTAITLVIVMGTWNELEYVDASDGITEMMHAS